jgi:hypothetical protein
MLVKEIEVVCCSVVLYYLGKGDPLMGFWPYFLQAHESDGGYPSPLLLDPSTSPIGTDTTLFCTSLLLYINKTPLTVTFPKPQKRKKKKLTFF